MGKMGSPLAMSTEFAALSVSLDWLPKGIGSGFKGGAPERSDAAKVNIGHDSDRRAADRSRYDGRDLLRLHHFGLSDPEVDAHRFVELGFPDLDPVVISIEAKLRRAGKGKRLVIENGVEAEVNVELIKEASRSETSSSQDRTTASR